MTEKTQMTVRQIAETKRLTGDAVRNQPVKGPKKTFDTPNHSSHSHKRSQHYHATILGGRQSAASITDQLNPDESVSERAATQGRGFPGLVD